jgi:hypothetical protein
MTTKTTETKTEANIFDPSARHDSRLHITGFDFTLLKTMIEKCIEEHPDAHQQYKEGNIPYTQYIWDIFWVATMGDNAWMQKHLYKYLNDTHIESALKRMMPIENW